MLMSGIELALRFHPPSCDFPRSRTLDGSAQNALVVGNTGLRRSFTAAMPSFSSGPVKAWNSNASDASKIGPAILSQWFMVYLVRRMAVGGPSASWMAT